MNTTTNTRGVSDAMVAALSKLVEAAVLMLAEIDTCGHEVDPAYRLCLYEAWEQGKAALSAPEPAAQGEVVAFLNTRYRTLFLASEIGSTERNAELIASGELARLYTAPPAQPAERVPDGWKLAMFVLQNDLYSKLPEEERAVCDALVAENPYIASTAPSEDGKGVEFCSVCRKPFGPTETRVGTGDGTMRANNGRGSFAHRHCYEAAAKQAAR